MRPFEQPIKQVIIFGLEDLAELAHYYLHNDPDYCFKYNVVAFTVNSEYIKNDVFKDRPVVAWEEIEKQYPPSQYYLFAPMSGAKSNTLRKKIFEEGQKKGFKFISYISNKANVFNSKIGDNCFILEDNNIQPFTEIGNNVVMWSKNHIGHSSVIKDHCFFTSGVILSGHCLVNERSFFGVGSVIRDSLTIGEGSIIGMGAVVTKHTEPGETYIGNPAIKR